MRPVPDNDFDTEPAEDLAQNPQSQDCKTLLSNSMLRPVECPVRVFLLAVLADGLEVSQMCMQGNQCPYCTAKR